MVVYRLVIIALLSLVSVCSHANDTPWKIIKSGSFEGLANHTGEVIIPPVYDAIGWSDGTTNVVANVIGYKNDDEWGLISIKNKKLSNPEFTILTPFSNGFIKAAIKGKFSNQLFYGLMDASGQITVDFKYFSIDSFYENLLLVSEYRDRSVFYGVIDNNGRQVLKPHYSSVEIKGRLLQASHLGKEKLFSLERSPVFDFWLDEIEQQNDGFLVSKGGKYGLVSNNGSVIHDVSYKEIRGKTITSFNSWKILNLKTKEEFFVSCDSLTQNSDATWVAHINEVEQLLSPTATQLFNNNENVLKESRNGLLLMQNQRTLKWSVFKESGETVLTDKEEIIFDSTYIYSKSKGRWDIDNYFGRQINERTVEQVMGAQGRNLAVRNYGYWGWLDFNGNQLIRFKYDSVLFGLNQNQFLARHIYKWGVADFSDHFIVAPEYDRIECIGDFYVAHKGYAKHIFSQDGRMVHQTTEDLSGEAHLNMHGTSGWGLILPSEQIIESVYDTIYSVSGFYILKTDGKVILLNQLGQPIIHLKDGVEEVLVYAEDWFLIKKDGQFGFMDTEGRLRIANRYDKAMAYSEGLAAVSLIGKWGFIDQNEQLQAQPFYHDVESFHNGLSIVRIDNKFGIIDKAGKEIVNVEWKQIERQATGNFVVVDFDNRYGLVNVNGGIILSPLYEMLTDTPLGLVVAGKYGKTGILNYEGYSQFPFEYDAISIKGDFVLILKQKLN